MFGLDPEAIAQAGVLVIALIVFVESGLLVGFFLPGDTLLIAAGMVAAQGAISIEITIAAIVLAAIIGDNVGYTIGQYSGKRLFHKKDGIFFRHEYVERAQAFYDKHGGKTIIIARFVPIVRTFAPVVAGIGKMPRKKFFMYNVVGALLWGVGLTLLGYWIGNMFPNLGHYLEYAIIGVVFLSFAFSFYHVFKDPRSRKLLKAKIKDLFTKSNQSDR